MLPQVPARGRPVKGPRQRQSRDDFDEVEGTPLDHREGLDSGRPASKDNIDEVPGTASITISGEENQQAVPVLAATRNGCV